MGHHRLWIDAICINQSPTTSASREKARQVRLMGTIYAQAVRVVVDLGEVDKHSDVALRLIRQFIGNWQNDEASLQQLGLPDHRDPSWNDLKHFLARPWFRRIWIVQEYVLGVTIEVIVGLDTFEGEMFVECAYTLFHRFNGETQFIVAAQGADIDLFTSARLSTWCMGLMSALRKALQAGQTTSIANLLPMSRPYLSTHTRDKIYGLLGLANDSNEIHVDYEIEEVEVLKQLAVYMIHSGHALMLLSHAEGHLPGSEQPSWLPDINSPFSRAFKINMVPPCLRYNTHDFEAATAFGLYAMLDPTRDRLHVRGFAGGCVEVLAEPLHLTPDDSGHTFADFPSIATWIKRAQGLAMSHPLTKSLMLRDSLVFHDTVLGGMLSARRITKDELAVQVSHMMRFIDLIVLHNLSRAEAAELLTSQCNNYLETFTFRALNMAFCITSQGQLALVPERCQAGYLVVVFSGAESPSILRPGSKDTYWFMGNCYIHGLMDGELPSAPGAIEREFILV